MSWETDGMEVLEMHKKLQSQNPKENHIQE
jgi:hypothetical protein